MMATRPRLHLVDGTYELFRAHYAPGPDRTDAQGRPVKAAVGLVRSLLALLDDEDEAVTHLAVAFDHPIESFRNVLFPDYKSSVGVDPTLLAQFDLAEAGVAALGVVAWPMDDYEADDALATAAVRFRDETRQVRICTPDKDLGQVVSGDRIVQIDRARARAWDEPAIRERLGVTPAQVPDYLALVGDTADGIPGLPGFGAKTATTLLARYPRLEDIPLEGEWDVAVRGATRLQETLRSRIADAYRDRDLATLRTDVPLPHTLDDLAFAGTGEGEFEPWCRLVGAPRLATRPRRWRTRH